MPEELSRNQSILRFDVILQHDWPIEQCLLHIRVFFGGKTKRPCFDLFIHWLIKQITNNYRNHFSRSYENRSIPPRGVVLPVLREFENCYGKVFRSHGTTLTARKFERLAVQKFERQGVDTVVACMRGFSVGKREDNCKQILREWIYESCYYTLCLEILRFHSAKILNGFV